MSLLQQNLPPIPQVTVTPQMPPTSPVFHAPSSANTANTTGTPTPPQGNNASQALSPSQAVLCSVKWDFINVFTPYTYPNGDRKYTITLIFDKGDNANFQKVCNAITAAYQIGLNTL